MRPSLPSFRSTALCLLALAVMALSGAKAEPSADPAEELAAGMAALMEGSLSAASDRLERAVTGARAGGGRAVLLQALTALSSIRAEQGRLDDAVALLAEGISAADLIAAGPDARAVGAGVDVRLHLSTMLLHFDRAADAESVGWEALGVAAEAGLPDRAGAAVLLILDAARAQEDGALFGRAQEMALALDPVLATTELPRSAEGVAALLTLLGRQQGSAGRLTEARRHFEAAARLGVAVDSTLQAAQCDDLLWSAIEEGDRPRVRALLRLCPPLLGSANPAGALTVLGLRAAASARYRGLAEWVGRLGGDPWRQGVLLGRAARVESSRGDVEAALALHEEAAAAFELAERPAEVLIEEALRGELLFGLGKVEEAEAVWRRVTAEGVSGDNEKVQLDSTLRARLGLARVALSAGRSEDAEAHRKPIAQMLTTLQRPEDLARLEGVYLPLAETDREVLERVTEAADAAGDPAAAAPAFEAAAERAEVEGAPESALDLRLEAIERRARASRGRLAGLDGAATVDIEPVLFPERPSDAARAAVRRLAVDRPTEALRTVEELLGHRWAARLAADPDPRSDHPLARVEEDLLVLRTRIDSARDQARIEAQTREPGAALGSEATELIASLMSQERALVQSIAAEDFPRARSLDGRSLAPDAIREALREGELLVLLFELNDGVQRFVVDRAGVTSAVVPMPASLPDAWSHLDELRPSARKAVARRTARAAKGLLGDISEQLRAAPRVYWVAEGRLNAIPPAALSPLDLVPVIELPAASLLPGAAASQTTGLDSVRVEQPGGACRLLTRPAAAGILSATEAPTEQPTGALIAALDSERPDSTLDVLDLAIGRVVAGAILFLPECTVEPEGEDALSSLAEAPAAGGARGVLIGTYGEQPQEATEIREALKGAIDDDLDLPTEVAEARRRLRERNSDPLRWAGWRLLGAW